MSSPSLYMILVGCNPPNRKIEQHDIFFGIANHVQGLLPQLKAFWPEAWNSMHIDAIRRVQCVGNFQVNILPKLEAKPPKEQLFFINLGGYKVNHFEEYHFKNIYVASSIEDAKKQAKQELFYREFTTQEAPSHIDNKYGIDIDEVFPVKDLLNPEFKEKYTLLLSPNISEKIDKTFIGYFPVSQVMKGSLDEIDR